MGALLSNIQPAEKGANLRLSVEGEKLLSNIDNSLPATDRAADAFPDTIHIPPMGADRTRVLTIVALTFANGQRRAFILKGPQAIDQAYRARRRKAALGPRAARVEDWRVAEVEGLAEARSCLMRHFGIGWFNTARKRLADLEAAR